MDICVTQTVNISDKEVKRIFNHILSGFIDGYWIEGDNVMEEVATSHRYAIKAGKVTDPEFSLVVAAINLAKELDKVKS